MGLFSRFKKKKTQDVRVTERRKNILNDTAAAVAFSEQGEHETARSLIDRTKGNRTILVAVRGENFSRALQDYSIAMAKRLDYAILALNVSEDPLSGSEEKRENAQSAFREACQENIQNLQTEAEKMGISFSNVIEWGDLDDVVARLHSQYPGMRYVLTEPDPDIVQCDDGQAAIPVFDLGSFQTSAV